MTVSIEPFVSLNGAVTPAPTLTLSVVMAVHNEQRTVLDTIHRILDQPLIAPLELLVVDDGSTDATPQLLATITDPRVTVFHHRRNRGKGAAVTTGLTHATGTHLLVFDADSEYDPADINRLLQPVADGKADLVYGARRPGHGTVYTSLKYLVGNKVTTWAANLLFGSCITDLHTCLKLVPTDLMRDLNLTETGFGLDTELSAELLRHRFRPYEIPVSYVSRTHAEGKQITAKDGIECLWVLMKVRGRRDRRTQRTPGTYKHQWHTRPH